MESIGRPEAWRFEVQGRVLDEVWAFAMRRFGRERLDASFQILEGVLEAELGPLLATCFEVEGRTPLAEFAASEEAAGLDTDGKVWLAAEQGAVLSAWAVKGVLKGRGALLVDRLGTAGTRFVHDVAVASPVFEGAWLLARVLEIDGLHYLSAVHQRPLCSHAGEEVMAAVAGSPSAVFAGRLIVAWRKAADEVCPRCEQARMAALE